MPRSHIDRLALYACQPLARIDNGNKRYVVKGNVWLTFDVVAAGIDEISKGLRNAGYAVLEYDARGLWGTAEAYQLYRMLQIMAEMHCIAHKVKFDGGLHHMLRGLEGKRVIIKLDGRNRIGYVGFWGVNILRHCISKREGKRGTIITPIDRVEVISVLS